MSFFQKNKKKDLSDNSINGKDSKKTKERAESTDLYQMKYLLMD